ncbi:unnamed protein product [Prorocentrum cordatum]|uniref:Uncharacterized protein n=1 Tax=Prorocentrum cordatum TaxID=2364126 RepID=A0ABN9QF61_9DINO|nr:unnamed protein product [Polarella glacialis]
MPGSLRPRHGGRATRAAQPPSTPNRFASAVAALAKTPREGSGAERVQLGLKRAADGAEPAASRNAQRMGEGARRLPPAEGEDLPDGVPLRLRVPGASPSKAVSREPQYSVDEALALQRALQSAFAADGFRTQLRRAEAAHPRRGVRGHADQAKFTQQLHSMLREVYRDVLPQKPWCLPQGWEGYRKMVARMEAVAEDPRVVNAREDINRLLGLPRFTVLRPPPEEPLRAQEGDGAGEAEGALQVFVELPDGSGEDQSKNGAPLFTDADGDTAHEFWEEDRGGNLIRVLPGVASTV